jgi:hypothetical protein
MTKIIHKFVLPIHDIYSKVTEVEMPKGAKILSCALDKSMFGSKVVWIWALVNPSKENKKRVFHVVTTDIHIVDYDKSSYEYVGTVGDNYHYHIFEVTE